MKIFQNVLAGQTGAAAKSFSGKLQNFDADGLLLDIKRISGAHTLADLRKFSLSATLRTANGKSHSIIFANVGDLLAFTDYIGGASKKSTGDGGTYYPAYLPLGNIILEGDDSLEIELRHEGHATAVYDVRATFTDFFKADESIVGYHSYVGNGNELAIKNAFAAFLTSGEAGQQVRVDSYEGQGIADDRDIVQAGFANGRMEVYDSFGPIFLDGTDLSQNIRVTLPNNATMLVKSGIYTMDRVARKAAATRLKLDQVFQRIKLDDPEKAQFLTMVGKYRG